MIAHTPASVEEASAVMAQTAREKQRIAFLGGGTQLDLGNPPEAIDAEVRTERMNRILDYAPSDMVITAEAGVTLAKVQETVRGERQMLALDPPNPDRATIGGLVATGAYGPRRARYGAVRDLIIGVTLVRADGVIARGGGKVVKNVAGFDLPKVACGSLGTLAMIGTATFRLHPLPEMSRSVRIDGLRPGDVVAKIAAIRKAQLEPASAVAMRNSDGTYDLGLRFEGFGKGVLQQIERVQCDALSEEEEKEFWRRHDSTRGESPPRPLAPRSGERVAEGRVRGSTDDPSSAPSLRSGAPSPRERGEGSRLVARIASLPTRLPAVDELVAPLLAALDSPSFAWYATLGLGFASGEVADGSAAIAAINAARNALVSAGGSLVVETAPHEMSIDRWGPVGSSFPLMQQLKSRFDPDRRLSPGRFVGGL